MARDRVRIEETKESIYAYSDIFVSEQKIASIERRPGREPLITVLNNSLTLAEATRVCAGLKAALKLAKKVAA